MNYYLVQTSQVAFSWVGGKAEPAGNGFVWLTKVGGERVLKVPSNCVRESSRELTARRIVEGRRASKAPLN